MMHLFDMGKGVSKSCLLLEASQKRQFTPLNLPDSGEINFLT